MTEIRIYKLLSGEEIIGYFKSATDRYVLLSKAHVIVPQQNEQGKIVILFAPWLIASIGGYDGDTELYWNAISGRQVKIPEQMERAFMEQTSGIKQPTAQEKSLILSGR